MARIKLYKKRHPSKFLWFLFAFVREFLLQNTVSIWQKKVNFFLLKHIRSDHWGDTITAIICPWLSPYSEKLSSAHKLDNVLQRFVIFSESNFLHCTLWVALVLLQHHCTMQQEQWELCHLGFRNFVSHFLHIQIFQTEMSTLSIIFLHPNIPDKWKRVQLSLDQVKKKERVKVKS